MNNFNIISQGDNLGLKWGINTYVVGGFGAPGESEKGTTVRRLQQRRESSPAVDGDARSYRAVPENFINSNGSRVDWAVVMVGACCRWHATGGRSTVNMWSNGKQDRMVPWVHQPCKRRWPSYGSEILFWEGGRSLIVPVDTVPWGEPCKPGGVRIQNHHQPVFLEIGVWDWLPGSLARLVFRVKQLMAWATTAAAVVRCR